MFKNRSFQKGILVLVFVALLVGAFASTYIQTIKTDLASAGSGISTNHRKLSTMSQKVKPGDEEDSVQVGLPPCSATFGNCKLGPSSATIPSGLLYATIRLPVPGEEPLANLFNDQLFNQPTAADQGEEMSVLIKFPVGAG